MLRDTNVEVDLYGSHAIAIILRAITMPFEVFISSAPVWETSYRASRASALAHSRNRPESSRYLIAKVQWISRGSYIRFLRRARARAGIAYLARNHESRRRASKSSSSPGALTLRFIKYLTFRYSRRNFSPAGCGGKKIDIIELYAVSVVRYNGPAHTSHSISPFQHVRKYFRLRIVCARARARHGPTLIIPDENTAAR